MTSPRDLEQLLSETGAVAASVLPPSADRAGWQVNLRRKTEGWVTGERKPSLAQAAESAAWEFLTWSERQEKLAERNLAEFLDLVDLLS